MSRIAILAAAVPLCLVSLYVAFADDVPPATARMNADKHFTDGNWKEAWEIYSRLANDPDNEGTTLARDFTQAVACLNRLQQLDQFDGFLDDVVTVHTDDWRLLVAAATSLQETQHYGHLVAGEFHRGNRRGGGQMMSALERDRTRSLQLFDQARSLVESADIPATDKSQFYLALANAVSFQRTDDAAWRLQDLTKLDVLPDLEEGYFWRGGQGYQGAPVDAEGNPVYHTIPQSWDAATSDGQRWRWTLEQVAMADADQRTEVDRMFADFLQGQFGVQTIRQAGILLPRPLDRDAGSNAAPTDEARDESGPWALASLGEDETIAKLANGVKRFTLPDEFNPIRLYQKIAASDGKMGAQQAHAQLAQIFEDRQQYPKAAEWWKKSIDTFGTSLDKQRRLEQIVGNWGTFETVMSQPAGQGATVDFRFRNGRKVSFTAHAIKIDQLLSDVKTYLQSNVQQLDWNRVQIDNIGQRLIGQDETKYLGEQVAQWDLDLEPRENHFDRRVTVTTPLQKAGAYWVVGKMADGNTSRIVLWLNDTAILKKPLNGRTLYYVADAVTGEPIEKANVEFFGWRQEQVPNSPRQVRRVTTHFAEFTDAEGMILLDTDRQKSDMQWLITARTSSGRLAHLGFTNVWRSTYDRSTYNDIKTILLTDRPVYRPHQIVQFKFWVRETKYDAEGNRFANEKFTIRITDPEGTEIYSKEITADEYGGLAGEYALPKDAKLGQYFIQIPHHRSGRGGPNVGGGGHFRVEEYKKPEFEVIVEAPTKPVMLGETVNATIRAKYYYGSPVTNATVKFKVERTARETRWFPAMPWDWLYGDGYWWFASDYQWYPGFARWGCLPPRPFWHHWNPDPPELVLDREVQIGEDGTVEVEIDTALAKLLHGDKDHEYKITAEVVDASRRTIVGTGNVIVAHEPFQVFAWTTRGHYRVGDTILAQFQARTPDGKGVAGKGTLKLLKVTYDGDKAVETSVQEWELDTNEEGRSQQEIKASAPGQYRLSYVVDGRWTRDDEGEEGESKTIEGGHLFVVRGEGFDGSEFRFNDLELVTDKTDYQPGDTAELLLNTNRLKSVVLLFERPQDGVYAGKPKLLRLDGKSTTVAIDVAKQDMPNMFVEAITVADGKLYTVVRELVVPPEQRVLNVEVQPNESEYLPGQQADIEVKLTDIEGKPFVGSIVLSVYDRAVEYISGGSNIPEIKAHFWKWRRNHNPNTEQNLARTFWNLLKQGEIGMSQLGAFGDLVADQEALSRYSIADANQRLRSHTMQSRGGAMGGMGGGISDAMPLAAAAPEMEMAKAADGGAGGEVVQPTIRSEFADTAYWNAAITTGADGLARVTFDMPENLTGWKVRAWGMGEGTRVGEGTVEVVTKKNLVVRMQAPRFFVEKDEVVLSAVVHNYLQNDKLARVELQLEGNTLEFLSSSNGESLSRQVAIPAGGEVRVDWRCRVIAEGQAKITMKGLTDEESDAMQMTFPVYVHGFLKTESFSGVVRGDATSGRIEFTVPEDRRPEQSRLEVRYSPTLAGSLVDALPYLVEYPYGCTEQTLNRFLPTVITQNILKRMKVDLKAVQEKRANLNAQEIGDDIERAKQWKHWKRNPVFDEAEVEAMVKRGVQDLTSMQLSDGGWGWFSGWGERSTPHTTAVVVHGLQLAEANGVALVPGVLDKGIAWLKRYQEQQVAELQEWVTTDGKKGRSKAGNLDALVYMVLADADVKDDAMRDFLYRDRLDLAHYAQALFGLALHKQQDVERRDMIVRNLDQFLKVDDENQTAYLDLPNRNYWWFWYGSNVEANAFYLKLLTAVNPNDPKAAGLVKYLLNNRKHATYWESTRDTAYCIEALADFLIASGESQPNLAVEVWLDGELQKTVEITSDNLFTYDNAFVIEGDRLTAGKHTLELRKKPLQGNGETSSPLYHNAYLTNFTTEDFITAAGLEIQVNRKFYKLVQRKDATDTVRGSQGQVIDQKALKYDRVELQSDDVVESGDLLEIELEIDSKNDYEYVIFEDLKAAGCEPVDLTSGYTRGGLGAYVEFRDERVAFFLRTLARGKHSVSYRVRAEIPGRFSALPTRAYAMYAPELKGNADELKLRIVDQE